MRCPDRSLYRDQFLNTIHAQSLLYLQMVAHGWKHRST
jgi:hypothetical protein